jgi:hypothetical protein
VYEDDDSNNFRRSHTYQTHNGSAVRGKGYGERRAGAFFWPGSSSLCTFQSPQYFLTIEGGAVWETKGKDPADGEAKEQEEGEGLKRLEQERPWAL